MNYLLNDNIKWPKMWLGRDFVLITWSITYHLQLINYEISYKHYVLFLFVQASWLLEKLQMGVIKQNIN
jgi:hypothetical protein